MGKSFQNQQIQPFAVQSEQCLGTGKAGILGTIMEVFCVFTAFSAAVLFFGSLYSSSFNGE